jgi:hypothetical protein
MRAIGVWTLVKVGLKTLVYFVLGDNVVILG